MSTSELRRGPGWWMDLDGQWKPPEEWPESSPPLPGWIRDSDGRWSQPASAEPESLESDEPAAMARPIPEVSMPSEIPVPKIPSLDSLRPPDPKVIDVAPVHLPPKQTNSAGTNLHDTPAARPSALTFSESTTGEPVIDHDLRYRREATSAAMLAAVTASMVAAGLVLLLLLL